MAKKGQENKQIVLDALPGTVRDVMLITGLKIACVSHWIKLLREGDATHISEWIPTAGRYRAYYVAGAGENVPEPKQKSSGEYTRRCRAAAIEFNKPFVAAKRLSLKRANKTIESGKDQVIGDLMAGLFAKRIKRQRSAMKGGA
jgi:hypothetical protein